MLACRSCSIALTVIGIAFWAGLPRTVEAAPAAPTPAPSDRITWLVERLTDAPLRARLSACLDGQPTVASAFSIGHRGASLHYPEHTRESYLEAARQGAGIIECDVTFTRDGTLICRHDQCDLHRTTNILETALADRCARPFTPADPLSGTPASALCCAGDLAAAEFLSLCGRHDRVDPGATSLAAYLAPGVPDQDLVGTGCPALMTHSDSIALFRALGAGMIPELKVPQDRAIFTDNFTLTDFAREMVEAYRAAGIPPTQVWLQSFALDIVEYWLQAFPEFAAQVVWLDGRYADPGFDPAEPATWSPSMAELRAMGLHYLAPPIPLLLTLADGAITISAYAQAARGAGLALVPWTLERPGTIGTDGGFYLHPVRAALHDEGDVFKVLHSLAHEAGVVGVFSDWPATTTFYANCLGQ
jgi:glycerophosphoryl diester phosphodiesterase